MKITKNFLRQIIKEEIAALNEEQSAIKNKEEFIARVNDHAKSKGGFKNKYTRRHFISQTLDAAKRYNEFHKFKNPSGSVFPMDPRLFNDLIRDIERGVEDAIYTAPIKDLADKVATATEAALTKMAGEGLKVKCGMRSKYLDSPNSGYQKMTNKYVRAMMSRQPGSLEEAEKQLKIIAKFVEELHCNPQPNVDPKDVAIQFLGLLMGTIAGIKSAERRDCVPPRRDIILPDNVGDAELAVYFTPHLDVIEEVAKGTYKRDKCPKKKK